MNANVESMTRFYSAFQRKDYQAMQNCYADKVIFYDPVFEDLVDDEVKLMWEMLCKRATDFSIEFKNCRQMMSMVLAIGGPAIHLRKQEGKSSITSGHICVSKMGRSLSIPINLS